LNLYQFKVGLSIIFLNGRDFQLESTLRYLPVRLMPIEDFKYTPCYCEENIWHLAQEDCFRGQETIVVIISGHGPYRKLWFQRSAEYAGAPVLWDYHVILLSRKDDWQVWDLDTTLGLPVPASSYFPKTFLQANTAAERADVMFRLIPATDYVEHFSSDRSHMKLTSGNWAAPPPQWPMIVRGGQSNLFDWLDVNQKAPGQLLRLHEQIQTFLR
jgi:hypothetical protein